VASAATAWNVDAKSYNNCEFTFYTYLNSDGEWAEFNGSWFYVYGYGANISECALLRVSNGWYWNPGAGRYYGASDCSGCYSGWISQVYDPAWSFYHISATPKSYNYAQTRHPTSGDWSPTYPVYVELP
jgi:hypothetical protein